MQLAHVSLDDKYALASGRVFLSGTQALVRLPLMRRALDAAAGLNTAGFISGYRGSPLGGYDQQLWRASEMLKASHIHFQPGVNEDLAATAIWGTQQVNLLKGAKYDGVFAIWYGKGPGVDRSGDPMKHANRMGTSPHGGVLVVFGDDHPGKSSTIAHQSELALAANGLPVLYPANVQEIIDYGLYGWALSRYAGVWVGLKTLNETVETTSTVDVDPARIVVRVPEGMEFPGEGVHARYGFDILRDEARLIRYKLPLAQAFVRANGLDRVMLDAPARRFGIVAPGKSYLDVRQALATLGIDAARAAALGLAVYKPAMIWPLEPEGITAFARGQRELLFVEEKAPLVEQQAARILYNLPGTERPRVTGKSDENGAPLLPSDGQLEPLEVARVIARRLVAAGLADDALRARLELIDRRLAAPKPSTGVPVVRTPYFCSGCPHNTSTRIPEGSVAMSGIGCHTMAIMMGRNTLPPTQMGGEGANWTGMAPFTAIPHMFQNLGDGTYFHSGLLAIRAAVNAGVNITYKLLYNDAVAMTGGQPVEGHLSVGEITRQVAAERVQRILVVSDEPEKFRGDAGLAPGTTVHHRDELDKLQRELRQGRGVSLLVYEQTCAAEKRRRRKRGQFPDPPKRAFINERVCEGCGDCSVQSNCVSVQPLETPHGRKRRIDQSNCNKDFSCTRGFCPSFVLVHGARPRARAAAALPADLLNGLPEPATAKLDGSYDVLITGIGGTGVVTIGAVLGMAAHLEGRGASVFDMTGLAQKGGAVLSHLRISGPALEGSPRIGFGDAELVLGCDLVVAAGAEALQSIEPGRTRVVVNTAMVPTAQFQLNPDAQFPSRELLAGIERIAGREFVDGVEATRAAETLLADTIGSNMFMVGFALQRGLLPLGREAVEQAIRMNGVAVEFNLKALGLGRLAAHAPGRLDELLDGEARALPAVQSLDDLIAGRAADLTAYQDAAYAERYRRLVEHVRGAERARTPGREVLATAVARYYFKLMAYKDEYEVARLYSDGAFRDALAQEFERPSRVTVMLSPPLLARKNPATGLPRKMEFGSWVFGLFGVLARLKVLRGTAFDIFGYTAERRLERRLIADYEVRVAELVAGLNEGNHSVAVELASLPERIRGFGHVKQRHLEEVQRREAELLERWRAPPAAPARAAA